MQTVPLPNKIYFTKDELATSEAVIEPLYPGYGVTLGNALRRVLLSSLPGGAVTGVKIKGVDHEFSTIPNVTEDVVDIILNLKKLRLRVHSEEAVRLTLTAKGQKTVTGADIKKDPRVEVVNPDLPIATIDQKSGELSMELVAEQGRGYVPVEMREAEKMEIGMIAVDAIFSPVRNVNFEVQNVRVGQITNYDKLTISMETDGTVSGPAALDTAAQILVDHFSLLLTSRAEAAPTADAQAGEAEELQTAGTNAEPESDLDALGLGTRALNALKKNGITSRAQLAGMTREDLEKLEGLGAKSIGEILNALQK